MGGNWWGLMTIVGPLILLVVLIWVVARNRRRRGSADEARTEQATRANYQAEHESHKGEPGSGL